MLWLLPDSLQAQLQRLAGTTSLPSALYIGHPDQGQAKGEHTTEVGYYQWATLLPLEIQPLTAAVGDEHVYEVSGMDTPARRLLEKFLGTPPDSERVQVYVLYPSNTTDRLAGGVESDLGPNEVAHDIRLLRTHLLPAAVPAAPPGLLLNVARDSFTPDTFFSEKFAKDPQDPDPWPFHLRANPLYTDSAGKTRQAAVIDYTDATQSYGGMAWSQIDAAVERPSRPSKVTFWAVAKAEQGGDPVRIEFQAGGVKEVIAVADR